jgi:hypothetical protein
MDPRVGLDDVEKRKFLTLPGLELRSLGRPALSQCMVDIFREITVRAIDGKKRNTLFFLGAARPLLITF